MFTAKLITKQNTFWLSGRAQWTIDETRAGRFSSRHAAYRAAASTKCVSRKWGDKVFVMPVQIGG